MDIRAKKVYETIDFKRGLDSKRSLDIGERHVKKEKLKNWFANDEEVILFGYFSEWREDAYIEGLRDLKIIGDTIDIDGEYMEHGDHINIRMSFDVDDIDYLVDDESDYHEVASDVKEIHLKRKYDR